MFLFCAVPVARAQDSQNSKSNFLSEARFFADIGKYLANDPYQKVYSWEANLGFRTKVYRRGPHAFLFQFDTQTAGAPPRWRRINIAGTSYLLAAEYRYAFREETFFSSGFAHLSTHLSEDIARIAEEEIRNGIIIPPVKFDDINIGFVEVAHTFPVVLEPTIRFRLQPVGVKFHGEPSWYPEPVFISAQFKLWGDETKNLLLVTRHELGEQPFNDGALRLDFLKSSPKEEGRLQLLFGYSPDKDLRASPNIGWHKHGFSSTLRFVFWAH